VQGQTGIVVADEGGEAEIRDDERVQAGQVRRLQRRQGRLHLVRLEQGVEREIGAGLPAVGELDRLHRGLAGEVAGERTSAEALEAEVDGVRPGGQRGAQRAGIPRRGEELRS